MKPSADSQHCEVARWRLKTTITTLEAKLLSCDQARHSLPCTRNHASADPCWGAVQALQAKVDGVASPSHCDFASGGVVPALFACCATVSGSMESAK